MKRTLRITKSPICGMARRQPIFRRQCDNYNLVVQTAQQHVSYKFIWIVRVCVYMYSWTFTTDCCLVVALEWGSGLG